MALCHRPATSVKVKPPTVDSGRRPTSRTIACGLPSPPSSGEPWSFAHPARRRAGLCAQRCAPTGPRERPRPSTAYITSSFRKPRGAFARTDDLFGQTLVILDGAGLRLVLPCDDERGQGTPCRAAGGRQPIRAAHPPMNRFAPTGHRRVCASSRRVPYGSSARNPAAAVMQKLKNSPPPLMQELMTSDRPRACTSVRARRSSSTLNHSIHPP